jgi:hypothetical protein
MASMTRNRNLVPRQVNIDYYRISFEECYFRRSTGNTMTGWNLQ